MNHTGSNGLAVHEENVFDARHDVTEISFALKMDAELCQKMVVDLRSAIPRIKEMREHIGELRIDSSLAMNLSGLKWKLGKFSLFGSDCSWQGADKDVEHCVSALDMCYKVIARKNDKDLKVKDIAHIMETLKMVADTFESKIEQLQAYIML